MNFSGVKNNESVPGMPANMTNMTSSPDNNHMIGIYSGIFVVGLANFLVIFAVIRNRKMHSVTNIYIVNLSIADACMICTLPILVSIYVKKTFLFGTAVCKMYWIAEQTNKYASVFFLTIMSVDRYFAICRPMQSIKYRTKPIATGLIVMTYVVVSILLTPVYMFARVQTMFGRPMCNIFWPDMPYMKVNNGTSNQKVFETNFFFFTLFFIFVVPTCIMLFFYVLILRKLAKLTDKAMSLHGNRMNSSSRLRRSQRRRASRTSSDHYRHVTKMIFVVIICHVICWTPYWLVNFVTFAKINLGASARIRTIFKIIHALPYVNSALNPILYGITNSNYRTTIRGLFCCRRPQGGGGSGRQRRQSNSAAETPGEACKERRCSSIGNSLASVIMELQMIVAHPAHVGRKEEAEIIYHSVMTGETKL